MIFCYLVPAAKPRTKKAVNVTITKDFIFYVDQNTVAEQNLELELIDIISGTSQPTITLRAEESVPISKVAYVMDIANRNKIKVILAVKP